MFRSARPAESSPDRCTASFPASPLQVKQTRGQSDEFFKKCCAHGDHDRRRMMRCGVSRSDKVSSVNDGKG